MLSTQKELEPYVAKADELAQELINNFASLIDAGHLNTISKESKDLFDLAQRHRLARRVCENHREADRLTIDDELQENQSLLAFAQALYDFDSSNHVWFK
jgi:hypothetical protein